jgi:HK97 family phage portal protein
MTFQERGRVGKPNAALFRNWAEHGDWVRGAIGFLKTQISQSEWDIVPYDRDLPSNDAIRSRVKMLFDRPNLAVESFRSFIEPIVEDILTLDAGVCEKERTFGGALKYLHAADGGKVLVSTTWDGSPSEPRYWWAPTPTYHVPFLNRDMVYIMSNPRTYSVVGLSPLETLKLTVDAELNASTYNTRQVTNAAPDGILNLGESARPDQVESFSDYWKSEVAGRGALAFLGGTKGAAWMPLRATNRDMQFLEWQEWLVRKISVVFGVSMQDLNQTANINRSEGEVQQTKTESRALRPLLSLLQDYLTREIVWDESFGGPENNWAFRFTRLNIKESLDKAQINKLALAGMPWISINTARTDEGRLPIGDLDDEENPYNKLMANTPLGIVSLEEVLSAAEAASKPSPAESNGKPAASPSSTGPAKKES